MYKRADHVDSIFKTDPESTHFFPPHHYLPNQSQHISTKLMQRSLLAGFLGLTLSRLRVFSVHSCCSSVLKLSYSHVQGPYNLPPTQF